MDTIVSVQGLAIMVRIIPDTILCIHAPLGIPWSRACESVCDPAATEE
jgi:hypothetical protein